MLLVFTLSLNAWLLTVIVLRLAIPCFQISWSVILTLFSVSLIVTVLVHVQRWRCWRYLRHGPQRLRSFHEDHNRALSHKYVVLLWLWWMVGTAVGITYICDREAWPWSLFSGLPACVYTAATWTAGCSSPDESLSESPPNVNAEDLDSSGELGSSVLAVN